MMDLQQLSDKLNGRRPTLQGARGQYAVLVPLICQEDGYHLLFEVRASTLHHQPGEVCFPGGAMESGEAPADCAMRETEEELGLDRTCLQLLGPLDFLIRGSGVIYPLLAILPPDWSHRLRLNTSEVASTFTVPLSWLRNHPPEVYRYSWRPHPEDFPYEAVGASPDYPWSPLPSEVPVYRGLPYPLWGMTARITHHLIDIIHELKDG